LEKKLAIFFIGNLPKYEKKVENFLHTLETKKIGKKWDFSFHTTILEKQIDRDIGKFAKLLKP
jgi:hypothetical protein